MLLANWRRTFILFVAALVLLLAGLPLLNFLQAAQDRRALALATDIAARAAATAQLTQNIAAAHELAGRIAPAEVERLLAPVDRLQIAALLEREAGLMRLQHFTYTLGAERKPAGLLTGEAQTGLAASDIALSADLPLDTDAYAFLDGLRQNLPGRLRLLHLTVERPDTHAALTASNLHLEAKLDWLSNGSAKAMAGEP